MDLAFPVGDAIAAALFGGYTRTDAHGGDLVPATVEGHQVGATGAGHGDYLPSAPPNKREEFAMDYAKSALQGRAARGARSRGTS